MEISDKELFGFFKENQFVLDETPNAKIWENIQAKLSKPFWFSNTFLLSVLGMVIIIGLLMNNKDDFPFQKEVVTFVQVENDSVKKKQNDTVKQKPKDNLEFKEIKNLRKPQDNSTEKISFHNPNLVVDTVKKTSKAFKVNSNSNRRRTNKINNDKKGLALRTYQKHNINSDTIKIESEELLLKQSDLNLLENLKIDSLNSVKELKIIEFKGTELKEVEIQKK